MKTYSDIPDKLNFRAGEMPINIDPKDLAELIEHMSNIFPTIANEIQDIPKPRTLYEDKNIINNMSLGYANHLKKTYLKETGQINSYLLHPANREYNQIYVSIVDDFQRKIIAKRHEYDNFDDVFNHLIDMISSRDAFLSQRTNKRLMISMLFYMYWNCDLGESE